MMNTYYDYIICNEPTRKHFCTFLDLFKNVIENYFSYIYIYMASGF